MLGVEYFARMREPVMVPRGCKGAELELHLVIETLSDTGMGTVRVWLAFLKSCDLNSIGSLVRMAL